MRKVEASRKQEFFPRLPEPAGTKFQLRKNDFPSIPEKAFQWQGNHSLAIGRHALHGARVVVK
ncbi:hypothetical protein C7120_00635 [Prevotella sp. oral taxon 376]|uniref:hypothetical protein n=1 Tax=Prevotella sp. oral taxon 376 TaxID=712466 RepID=UPI000D1E2BB7|nr:hypothetical protein [Prevotella sp. oral taxon 376]PTL33178.1 hypothetical protein C7120_00635 [Prevotella sp. oral taxon 376]